MKTTYKERDKFLTEAMSEYKHEWDKDYYLAWRLVCDMYCIPISYNFSTWEGFGKLWEWAQKQEWWSGFGYVYGQAGVSGNILNEQWISPNRFADAVYKYLVEAGK